MLELPQWRSWPLARASLLIIMQETAPEEKPSTVSGLLLQAPLEAGILGNPGALQAHTAWNEAYIMLVSCIDYALDMTCIQSVSQCFIVGGIL